MKKLLTVILISLFVFSFAACCDSNELPVGNDESTSISAGENEITGAELYSEDTTIGEGEKAVSVSVITPDKTVNFTIMTDKTNLGDALTESGLAEGEEGPYGLYIKKVNGISAVYEENGAYWSVSVNGEATATGADGIEINESEHYELTYKL